MEQTVFAHKSMDSESLIREGVRGQVLLFDFWKMGLEHIYSKLSPPPFLLSPDK